MVKAVGCSIPTGKSVLYNYTFPNSADNLELKSLSSDDYNEIEQFFQEIKIYGTIDCLCVQMDHQYKNEFRKKFVEISSNYSNVKNIRIIGIIETILFGAIDNLSFAPENDDILLIFDCREEGIFFYFWKFNQEQKWKFVEENSIVKEFKGWNKCPTIADLQKLKSNFKEILMDPYKVCLISLRPL